MKGKLTPVIFSDILLHIQEELQKRFFCRALAEKFFVIFYFLRISYERCIRIFIDTGTCRHGSFVRRCRAIWFRMCFIIFDFFPLS